MEELVKEHGVNTFKIDMETEGDEEGTVQFDNQQMIEIFECCKNLGAVVQVHAENGVAIKQNENAQIPYRSGLGLLNLLFCK